MKKYLPLVSLLLAVIVYFGSVKPAAAQFSEDAGSEADMPEYEYPRALHIPKGSRPRVQAEERVNALKRFSLDLYKQICGDETRKNKNLVCSPWSTAMVLTMLYDGANAETAKEIRKALHFQGNSRFFEKYLFMAAFNARAKNINGHDTEAPLILETANSLWTQTDYPFLDTYRELLDARFLAEPSAADFINHPEQAVKEINEWCSEKTHGEITKIISKEDIDPLTRIFVLNAVYFKARWEKIFDPAQTKPEWFHHADGSVSKTPMMNQKTAYSGYCEMADFKVLRKVNAGVNNEDDDCEMVADFKVLRKDYCGNAHILFLLPNDTDGLEEMEKNLTPKTIRQIDDRLKNEMVNIKMPRFAVEFEVDLIPLLKNLGIVSAFDAKAADFSKMTEKESLSIYFFRQTATVKLDEEGTVASAVTASGFGGGPSKVYSFYADRPFLFLIRENTDNTILFIGRVHQPEEIDTGEK